MKDVVREVQEPLPPEKCPHCGSPSFRRHGRHRGKQRYRCKTCGRTFSDLTGTLGDRLHKKSAFRRFTERFLEIVESVPVRLDAGRLSVSPATVWRWRHRILSKRLDFEAKKRSRNLGTCVSIVVTQVEGVQRMWRSDLIEYRRKIPTGWWLGGIKRIAGQHPTTVVFVADLDDEPGYKPGEARSHCFAFEGDPNVVTIGRRVVSLLRPGSKVFTEWSDIQLGLVRNDGRYFRKLPSDPVKGASRVTWVPRPEYGYRRIGRTRRGPEPALELRDCFYGWMAPFRGVKAKYIPRYVTWFDAVALAVDLKTSRTWL